MRTIGTRPMPWAFVLLAMSMGCAEATSISTSTDDECQEKSVRYRSDKNRRHSFAFPSADGAFAGTWVESACLRLTGISGVISVRATHGAQLSINGGAYTSASLLSDGDSIRVRAQADMSANVLRWIDILLDEDYVGTFLVRTRNDDREAMVFKVGPTREFHQLDQVADLLRAGDTVEVDGAATYSPVALKRSGLPDKPITIRGIVRDGKRPVFSGGTHTVVLDGAHHYRIENIDVTGGTQACIKHSANDVKISSSRIHHCARHGVLGTDEHSGSLLLESVEVDHAGGAMPGENLKHPVYVATDRDRYPGSSLAVAHSFIHDFGGIGIKSRAERAEIYYNWIDAPPAALYSLEMNGYQVYESTPGLAADIVGNVLQHRGAYGLRFGGDGTGSMRGRVRFNHNTVLVGPAFTIYTPVIRLFGHLESVQMSNNVFHKISGADRRVRILRDDVTWISGSRLLAGTRNWVPSGSQSISSGYFPGEWTMSIFGSGNPGYMHAADFDTGVLEVLEGSEISAAAESNFELPAPFQIANPLAELEFEVSATRPGEGSALTPLLREASVLPFNVGAR